MTRIDRVCSGALLLAALLSLAPSVASANPLFTNVWTTRGPIVGAETDFGYEYLGVPYAAQPERWKAPEQPRRWWRRLDATQLGPACAQPDTPFGVASVEEDCLSLNVYRPQPSWGLSPVMVWIHGGSYKFGQGGDTVPRKLVEQGMTVVTINYRLGALGFLSHPSLSAESPDGTSGNYGLMDQQAALRWVRDNILRFGGDPNNVTIFGESAGGHSVLAHLTSPASSGLFDRAIVQSGSYVLEQPAQSDWEFVGQAVMAEAGCPTGELECMRALPVESILATQDVAGAVYLSVVDGQLLPLSFAAAIASGQFNQVPVMTGTTRDEYMLFIPLLFDFLGNPVTEDNYFEAIASTLRIPLDSAATIGSFVYPTAAFDSPSQALGALGTDAVFACQSLALTNLLAQHVPTYGYEFADAHAPNPYLPPMSYPYGAFHAAEIQYLMDVDGPIPVSFDAGQQALSDEMVGYWAQFADSGDPNSGGAPGWTPFAPASGQLDLQSLQPGGSQPLFVGDFSASHLCDFWASL